MRESLCFWVVGGDPRQAALSRALSDDGHQVHTYALEEGEGTPHPAPDLSGIGSAHCVVLPLPSDDGELLNTPLSRTPLPLSDLLSALRPSQLLCAGRPSPRLRALSEERGLRLIDYFAREDLTIANAVPTSEGAIQLAMEELPITLHGARVLVIGYGRLGKVLAYQLQGLGAHVSVAARKQADLSWIRVWGCEGEETGALQGELSGYDLIINTVPAPVLSRPLLAELREGCLVIDLASKPGGVDFDGAAQLGVKVIWALSLPGKVAPVTAARAIRDTIYNILSEQGV